MHYIVAYIELVLWLLATYINYMLHHPLYAVLSMPVMWIVIEVSYQTKLMVWHIMYRRHLNQ